MKESVWVVYNEADQIVAHVRASSEEEAKEAAEEHYIADPGVVGSEIAGAYEKDPKPVVKLIDGTKVVRYKGGTRKRNTRTHAAVEDYELQQKQRERVRIQNETWTESNNREVWACKRSMRRR